jgi:hypothetical protein
MKQVSGVRFQVSDQVPGVRFQVSEIRETAFGEPSCFATGWFQYDEVREITGKWGKEFFFGANSQRVSELAGQRVSELASQRVSELAGQRGRQIGGCG